MKHFDFISELQVPWRAALVMDGESYGLRNMLKHHGAPMIEFYDKRGMSPANPNGQFVQRYYVKSLEDGLSRRLGILLQGDVPIWRLGAESMEKVFAFLIGAGLVKEEAS